MMFSVLPRISSWNGGFGTGCLEQAIRMQLLWFIIRSGYSRYTNYSLVKWFQRTAIQRLSLQRHILNDCSYCSLLACYSGLFLKLDSSCVIMQQNNSGDNDPPGYQLIEVLITVLFLTLCVAVPANSLTSYVSVYQFIAASLCLEDAAGAKRQHIPQARNSQEILQNNIGLGGEPYPWQFPKWHLRIAPSGIHTLCSPLTF